VSFLKANKVLHHPEKFTEWQNTGDTSGPVTVKVDLTNVCNHNCPGCIDFDLIENDNNNLSMDMVENLLESFKKTGTIGINYTGGGEPTVHKKFTEIINKTHDAGYDIGLITNGSRFHKLPMEEILKKFTWIRISLDAYDQETHKRTHGTKAKFDLTIKNIKKLVEIKQQQNLDVTIGVGFITNQFPDMDRNAWKFVELCKNAKVDYVQMRPSFGFLYDYESISSEELQTIFKKLKAYEEDNFSVYIDEGKYEKILSGTAERRTYNHCHAQSFKATSITATGDVYVCCSLSGVPKGWVGNIKIKNFHEIWDSDVRKKQLEKLDIKKCPALCVGDNLNEFLDQFKNKKPVHKNFL
tara:strand:+ start:3544 stop:4605 length:1062 start_codon:yes stop_codon:yes gene_type:complete